VTGPRPRRLAVLAVPVAAAATVVLFLVSRGKWSDPIIDSGREWIVPDALARGELLYRDVVYWFGPFTPYFQSLFLRVFGSSLASLVLSGAVASVGILAALYFALRTLTDRAMSLLTTILAVPALLFMPNAGGALLGMGYRIWHAAGFGLAALALACREGKGGRRRMAAAGALAGLSGLCRTEWGLVILAAVLLARVRLRRKKGIAAQLGFALLLYAAVFGGVLFFFVAVAGRDAVIREGHVLLTGLPEETRRFLLTYSGIGDWKAGTFELLYSFGMWLAAFEGVALLAARRPGAPWSSRGVLRLLGLLLFLAVLGFLGAFGGAVLFSAGPLVCLVAIVAGWRLRPGRRSAALASFGLAGLILSCRRPFHIGDGAYVGPPLLLALVCAAGLLRLRVLGFADPRARSRLAAALAGVVGILAALAFAGRLFQYSSDGVVPISGTRGMLCARPQLARELAALAGSIRDRTREPATLAAFPEGEVLNLLSGRANPIRHKLYIPGYLTRDNEAAILDELERSPPSAVVIVNRIAPEYGPAAFGDGYGVQLRRWLDDHYALEPFEGRVHGMFSWGLRR